jgi:hypothetical protein
MKNKPSCKKKVVGTVLIDTYSSRDSIEPFQNSQDDLRKRIKSAINKIRTSPSNFKNIQRIAKSPEDLRSVNLKKH